jgi:hypothetical protein
LEGRVLEFYKWDTDAELLLKDAREKLNELSKVHTPQQILTSCKVETDVVPIRYISLLI